MRLGFHADDDESETGGDMQSQGVTVDDSVGDIVERDRAERHARMKDVVQTFIVAACIVCGITYTGLQFVQDKPGTSHMLYTLAKAYPGPVLIFGVWFGVVWREWCCRHPWWAMLAAYMLGHSLFPIWPW